MSKKTLSAIANSGNDYLVKVKTNQPKLYEQIETESNQQKARQTVEHQEKTRDRHSYRQIQVFEPPENPPSARQIVICKVIYFCGLLAIANFQKTQFWRSQIFYKRSPDL